ncbi:MAG TPA: GAF domain-containing protein [Gemmatimonadaceae bacterium]|jgi:GAF domain-containing protein|nr:MAG: hypothetical protein ABS52_13960 [Gemmatimonadetes bacterium SCN 70-22]HMN09551.1 GAF domain-containing protein [Gemmatimonadaceae bacterium]
MSLPTPASLDAPPTADASTSLDTSTLRHTAEDEAVRLRERIDDLTRERDQLLVVVDLQRELGSSLQVAEVLQRIARRLGELFGLDRSSIYLAGEGNREVHLVATYEDPTLSNLAIDLDRYPELAHAFTSGQTVFIRDVQVDPRLERVREALDLRSVRSIVVVPIRWRTAVIGAIVLRTERGSTPFSDRDIQFCEVIASLAARALRNAHRFERVQRAEDAEDARRRRLEMERIAFVGFIRRLVARYARSEDQLWAETLLPRESDEELDRLVSVALQVIAEESKG